MIYHPIQGEKKFIVLLTASFYRNCLACNHNIVIMLG